MQSRILPLAAAITAVLALGAGRLSVAADSTAVVIDWSAQQSERAKAVLSNLVRWPSEEELASSIAESDTLAARRYGEEWLRLVLQATWIPADILSRFKPVRRNPAGYDVLVAQYAVANCNLRIWDTSMNLTIQISSPSL